MDPFIKSIIGSIMRWLVTGVAAWLVSRGVLASGDSAEVIAGATTLLITLVWTLYQKYCARVKFLTALESPAGTSEAKVDAKIAAGAGAPLSAGTGG
jgi:hypothetical protein